MYSYRQFTPGNKSKCGKLITYAGVINANPNLKSCTYTSDIIINKDKFTSQPSTPNISNIQRVSQIINNSIGGSTQFGNYYLGKPVVFNYLGRVEGQPGGSGTPLRNKF